MPFFASDFKPRFDETFFAPDFLPRFGETGAYPISVSLLEWNGAQTPGTYDGTSVNTANFGYFDAPDLVSSDYKVPTGSNSYAKYLKVQFSGAFVQISNAKIWKFSGDYVTGESLKFSGSIVMAVPSPSDVGVDNIPTSLPGTSNLTLVAGATTDSVLPGPNDTPVSPGHYSGSRSALMVFQVQTTSESPAGDANLKSITLTYDRF